MVPSAFVLLDALPLTANGKVDRKALPAPDDGAARAGRGLRGAAHRRPRRPWRPIWARSCGSTASGVDDNFFELGGDSILSIQVVCAGGEAGPADQPQAALRAPDLAGWPRWPTAAPADRRRAGPGGGPVPLTPIQRWFFEAGSLPSPHHFNQSVLLATDEAIDVRGRWRRPCDALLAHHDALRLRFSARGRRAGRPRPSRRSWPRPGRDLDLSSVAGRAPGPGHQPRPATSAGEPGPGRRARWCAVLVMRPRRRQPAGSASWPITWSSTPSPGGSCSRTCRAPTTQRSAGQAPALPAEDDLVQRLGRAAGGLAGRRRRGPVVGPGSLPAAAAAGSPPSSATARNLEADAATVTRRARARPRPRALLHEVPAAYRTQINDVLLTALAQALAAGRGLDRGAGRTWRATAARTSSTTSTCRARWAGSPRSTRCACADRPDRRGRLRSRRSRSSCGRCRPGPRLRPAAPSDGPGGRLACAAAPAGQLQLPRASSTRRRASAVVGSPRHLSAPAPADGPRWPGHCSTSAAMCWTAGSACDDLQRAARYGQATVERAGRSIWPRARRPDRALPGPGRGRPHAVGLPAGGARRSRASTSWWPRPERGRRIEDIYPLAPLQQGMLFHTLLAPARASTSCSSTGVCEGDLDADGAAAGPGRGASTRHAVLRTAFVWQGLDEPLQVVRRAAGLPWSGWTGRGLDRRDAGRAPSSIAGRGPQPRLRAGPRAVDAPEPVDLGDERAPAVWSFHHLLLDGWSMPVVLAELVALYEAPASAAASALAPARRRTATTSAWLAEPGPGRRPRPSGAGELARLHDAHTAGASRAPQAAGERS